MALTKEDFVNDPYGTVYHFEHEASAKRIERWRKNGAVKLWKTRPDEFRVPVKHGLRDYAYITELEADGFHRENECENG